MQGRTTIELFDSQIKRHESTADTFEKGNREWAYAKNDMGGEHYAKARDAFDRAERHRNKSNELKNK